MNLPFSLFPFLHRFPSISCVYFSVVLADILTYLIKIWETDIFTGSRQASFWRFPHEEVKNTHTQIPSSWDTQTHECLCDNDELAWYFNTRHWIRNPLSRWDYICLDVYTRLRVSRGRADVDVGGRSLVLTCYLCYGFKPWQDTSNHIVSNETPASIGRSVLSPSPVIHPISPKLPPPSWQNVDPLGRPSGH